MIVVCNVYMPNDMVCLDKIDDYITNNTYLRLILKINVNRAFNHKMQSKLLASFKCQYKETKWMYDETNTNQTNQ